jgi:hypothetical protein
MRTEFDPIAVGDQIAVHPAKADAAKATQLEHSTAAGVLLLDAQRNHPKHLDDLCQRIRLGHSRRGELLMIASGKRTPEETKAKTKARVDKHRENKKAKALPKPEPDPLQPFVTDSSGNNFEPDASAGAMKAAHAAAEAQPDPLNLPPGLRRQASQPHDITKAEPVPTWNDPIMQFGAAVEVLVKLSSNSPETFVGFVAEDKLDKAWNFVCAVSDETVHQRDATEKADRIKWEAKNPVKAKAKARDQAIADAMGGDMDDAKQEAKDNGDRWGDGKDEWIEQWMADNWGEEQEAEFEAKFAHRWERDHALPTREDLR